jgi:hypothetical protein
MAFKTFAPGVLTSSDMNTFLMRQAVIVCTSSTRPASPNAGMTIYETDTNSLAIYTGTAWIYRGLFQSFTPTIASGSTGWAVGNGTATGKFTRVGNVVVGHLEIVFGSTSTFGATTLDINAPVNIVNNFYRTAGVGGIFDQSAGNGYQIALNAATGSTLRLNLHGNSLGWDTQETVTSTRPFTWNGTDNDLLAFSFCYEAA